MTFAFVVSAALMVGFALLAPPRRCAWCGAIARGHDVVRHYNEAHRLEPQDHLPQPHRYPYGQDTSASGTGHAARLLSGGPA